MEISVFQHFQIQISVFKNKMTSLLKMQTALVEIQISLFKMQISLCNVNIEIHVF